MHKIIEKRFAELKWLDNKKTDNFYAIGGSFRAMARMHMVANNYPLRILHEYKVDAKNFLAFAREIAAASDSKLEKFPGVTPKRIPALPGAAIVLDHIVAHTKPDHIIFSTSGIREGYLYEKLSPHVRNQDGLLSSCTEFAAKGGRSASYAHELFTWMYPLMQKESEKERRLRLAFCLLSDIAMHIHPEYRAEWAFHRILFSALTGLTHRERVKLSLAMYHRYQFKLRNEWAALKLLKGQDREWAKIVGSAANLAYHLSGSIAGNLHNTSFTVMEKDHHVVLQL